MHGQRRDAGQLHLGAQFEAAAWHHVRHAPEVERIADDEVVLVAAAATQARAADELVHRAAQLPKPVAAIPTGVAADRRCRRKRARGRGRDPDLAVVEIGRAAGPIGIAGHRAGVGPRGFDFVLGTVTERSVHRLAHRQQLLRHQSRRAVVAAHSAIAQPFCERSRDRMRHRRDQVDPQRTESRRQHRNGHHDARTQAARLCHHAHEIAIREDVRAADVERRANGLRDVEARDEVVQHVAHRDRLRLGRDPTRCDHRGQVLDEVAQDLERRRTRSNDHRGAEHRDRHARGCERVLDFAA